MVGELEHKIKKVMEEVAPMKTLPRKRKGNQWLKKELRQRMTKVKELQENYMSQGTSESKEVWKKARRETKSEMRSAKKRFMKKGDRR